MQRSRTSFSAQSTWSAFDLYQRAYHQLEQIPKPIWIEGVSPPREELADPSTGTSRTMNSAKLSQGTTGLKSTERG